jgi:hypothetical protein
MAMAVAESNGQDVQVPWFSGLCLEGEVAGQFTRVPCFEDRIKSPAQRIRSGHDCNEAATHDA